ncbi:mycofactocin biosynthesis glycosyltransferase MftF [soil metagenome]
MSSLPEGFAVGILPSVRVREGGRTLVGGSPLRVSYLSEAARGLFVDEVLVVRDASSRRLAEHLLAAGLAEPLAERLAPIEAAEITCVIPVRDRAESLQRLLESLGSSLGVVVVDDASHDPGAIATVARRHGAQLVVLAHNVGPAGARNAGLAAVATPYVVFIDSDIVIDAASIDLLTRHFHDPKVAVAAPRILGLGAPAGWLGRYETARSSLDLGPNSALVRPLCPVSWVPSAVMAARVEALGDGFDGSMNVGEDVELVWRVDAADWRVRYEARATARHDHRVTPAAWLRRKAFYGTGAALLVDRHGSKVAPAVFTPLTLGITAAALAQRRWSAPIVAALTALLLRKLDKSLQKSERPLVIAAELTVRSLGATFVQLTALMLRHWWPIVAVGSIFSPRLRRAAVIAGSIDTIIEFQRTEPDLDIIRFGVARRVDDLAYGAGLWTGAIRARSFKSLMPTLQGRRRVRSSDSRQSG